MSAPASLPAPFMDTFTFNVTDILSLSLRAIMRDGAPWFIAKDVCGALGYANASKALADHVEPEDWSNVSLGQRGLGAVNIISEPGLYSLISGSKKPEAKAFKRWVMRDVLPTIRKQGAYVQGAGKLSPAAQDALYANIRGVLREALRRYDKDTEHTHWRSLAKQRDWVRLSAEKVAREMGLPLDVVLAAGSHGIDAGMSVLANGR
ncbi:putative phage-encoded protein [Variovorax sp. SRS16]|uniref:BRO-N domain-containing protein n=1 Tax=Variovorax sp. SRS16 TaxID=282217 RepID=UPI00131778E1|nr:BRO family protein [Variovorax sp. SRS16]VTU21908.1 putative phage-encoded protein [Variovorax sp. SRS16]